MKGKRLNSQKCIYCILYVSPKKKGAYHGDICQRQLRSFYGRPRFVGGGWRSRGYRLFCRRIPLMHLPSRRAINVARKSDGEKRGISIGVIDEAARRSYVRFPIHRVRNHTIVDATLMMSRPITG